jgi:four helix bundle protein
MQNFRKLNVYIKSKELVIQVYALLQNFPKEEKYGLCDQLRRAVISVPSNIAEGLGRSSEKDKGHFMQIAYGSLMEVLAQLDIAHDLRYITDDEFTKIEQLIIDVIKLLKGLINKFTN